jgi:hypothetical protein
MRRALALALAVGFGATGCGRKAAHPPPERHVAADAGLAVSVPAVGAAARQAGALLRTVSRAPPAAPVAEAHAAVKAQLGFDPLDPRGLEQAGVDPAGGAALAGGPTPVLVLPVLDLGRLDATVARLARDRMAAGERLATRVGSVDVVVFRREPAGPASLAYAAAGPYALLAQGPKGPEAVAAAAALPEDRSLLRSPAWERARSAVGDGFLATLLAPPGSTALAGLEPARDGAALGLRCSATHLGARLALLLPPERERGWNGLRASPGPAAGAPEVARLPADAALVLRWGGDPAAARRLLGWLPAGASRSLAAAGIDLERDLFPALGPGPALSLSLAPTFTLAAFSSPRLDARRTDPFRLARLEAVLPLRDLAKLRDFLGRLQRAGPRLGLKVAARGPPHPSGPAAPPGWTVSWGKAQLGLSVAGDRLLVAGGPDLLAALQARAAAGAGGYEAPTDAARAALATGLGGAVLDVGHLAGSVAALPEQAYGTGPNAFVMRSLVARYLEPAETLASVSARLDLAPGAALVDLELVGRPVPAAQP